MDHQDRQAIEQLFGKTNTHRQAELVALLSWTCIISSDGEAGARLRPD